MIYLDHNATGPLDGRVLERMLPFLREQFGNASSIHALGRTARDGLEKARAEVARLCGAQSDEIFFSGSGTEANNLAIFGAAENRTRVVTGPLEHPSAMGPVRALGLRGVEVHSLQVDSQGRVDLDDFRRAVDRAEILVVAQLANHEIGNVNPIAEMAAHARAVGAWFHTDAVQAAGKIPVDVRTLGVDSLSLSAHKLSGPKGTGALYLRRGHKLTALLQGGHQERGMRAGTENVAGAVGMGAACALAAESLDARGSRMSTMRDRLEAGLVALGGKVNGNGAARVPNTTNVAWQKIRGELVVMNLDLMGVAVSTGAACTSGSVEPSPVLLALGQAADQARCAVRFSVGPETTEAEIDRVLGLMPEILNRIGRVK